MRPLMEHPLLSHHMHTLSDTSKGGAQCEPMTTCSHQVINIDKAMREYALGLVKGTIVRGTRCGMPPSADALLCDRNGASFLVEFKSGNTIGRDEIRAKLLASLAMLCDVCGLTHRECREELGFVLVYDRAAVSANGTKSSKPSRSVQASPSRGDFADRLAKHAKWEPPPTKNLKTMHQGIVGVFVRSFDVLDKRQFDSFLAEHLIQSA